MFDEPSATEGLPDFIPNLADINPTEESATENSSTENTPTENTPTENTPTENITSSLITQDIAETTTENTIFAESSIQVDKIPENKPAPVNSYPPLLTNCSNTNNFPPEINKGTVGGFWECSEDRGEFAKRKCKLKITETNKNDCLCKGVAKCENGVWKIKGPKQSVKKMSKNCLIFVKKIFFSKMKPFLDFFPHSVREVNLVQTSMCNESVTRTSC